MAETHICDKCGSQAFIETSKTSGMVGIAPGGGGPTPHATEEIRLACCTNEQCGYMWDPDEVTDREGMA